MREEKVFDIVFNLFNRSSCGVHNYTYTFTMSSLNIAADYLCLENSFERMPPFLLDLDAGTLRHMDDRDLITPYLV
jgi:hypothetical protein